MAEAAYKKKQAAYSSFINPPLSTTLSRYTPHTQAQTLHITLRVAQGG
jgi:hypothetical protein